MLCSVKTLEGCVIAASDGPIGHVDDFFIDDEAWVIRHLVVDCGKWLPGRKVLVSPRAIGHLDWAQRELSVSITKEQVRNSPDVDTDMPISRQQGVLLYALSIPRPSQNGQLLGRGDPDTILPGYGGFGSPDAIREESDVAGAGPGAVEARDGDPHLRSCRELMKYHVHADDGDIGHVEGLLVDDQTWTIRYLVVNTSNWWLGHRVLVAPAWINEVSWVASSVSIHLSRDAIRRAVPYDAAITFSRTQEADMYRNYDRLPYWMDHGEPQIREPS